MTAWGGMCSDAPALGKEPQEAESWPGTTKMSQQWETAALGLQCGSVCPSPQEWATLVSWHKSNAEVACTHAQED